MDYSVKGWKEKEKNFILNLISTPNPQSEIKEKGNGCWDKQQDKNNEAKNI